MNYKVAVVSGASSGIGRAIAEVLANSGIKLVLIARRAEKLHELSESLRQKTECFVLACDLSNANDIDSELGKIPIEFRDVDILINCAGAALGLEVAQEASWKNWQDMINVNCTALAKLTHYFLPPMVQRNSGHIINIGSIAASYPYKGGNAYGATKAFVEQFTRNLKADLLGTAVRVSNIEPGMVSDTEFSLVRFNGDTEKVAETYEGIEALTSVDIANAVEWILSQPPHVNINSVEIMPVCQAPSRTAYHRQKGE